MMSYEVYPSSIVTYHYDFRLCFALQILLAQEQEHTQNTSVKIPRCRQ